MRALIIGGSGSGKSRYAENFAYALGQGGPLIYLATMSAGDSESQARIRRHREQRRGLGFQTVEQPQALDELTLPDYATVLLEDLGNLAANEIFSQGVDRKDALQRIEAGIAHLERSCAHLIVVGNALFSDGAAYDEDTMYYLRTIAAAQNRMAARFDRVIEVVCGRPIFWKGEDK